MMARNNSIRSGRLQSLVVQVLLVMCLIASDKTGNLVVDALSTIQPPSKATTNRRLWLQKQGVTAASFLAGAIVGSLPLPALAAGVPKAAELEKLQKGHARVQYLLEHWDDETQICGKIVMSDTERKQVVRTEGKGFNC
jgi:hypothetical protein